MGTGQVSAEYQRIKQVMGYLNFSSDRKFAESIGVSPQNFYDIKAGRQHISRALTDKVTEAYPEINATFLLIGEGEMLKAASIQHISGNGNHHNTNGSDAKYIAHLEAEIELLRKEKEELWNLVQKLMK